MQEKRKNLRTELSSKLVVNCIGGNSPKEVSIEVYDLSKTGMGFYCTEALTIGAVYDGYLTIWTKEVIHVFIEIVRIVKKDNTFQYGATFVGMTEMESQRIGIYQQFDKE